MFQICRERHATDSIESNYINKKKTKLIQKQTIFYEFLSKRAFRQVFLKNFFNIELSPTKAIGGFEFFGSHPSLKRRGWPATNAKGGTAEPSTRATR